jgi:2-hydroxy-3-keto-5-methylthiopentenyl-1-phosphate phosphatase
MSDSSPSVRDEIINQLNKFKLGEKNIESLQQQFSSSQSEVRQEVAKYLGTIQSKKAFEVLTDQRKVEQSPRVKDEIEVSILKIESKI